MKIIVVKLSKEEYPVIMECLPVATKHRRAVVAARRSEDAKALSLTAELIALNEIRSITGIEPSRIRFEHGTHGKPYLKGGAVEFSLSHTDGAVCAAFSQEGEVGVDIELKNRNVSDALKRRTLSDTEQDRISTSEDFMQAWVQKEAFLKRTGIGITTSLKTVDTSIIPDTCAVEYGDYFIGISGKGAAAASIVEISAKDLAKCFSRDLLLL